MTNMSWNFATVNGRLAEIYFDKSKRGIKALGHCYVKRSDFKTKKEQKEIGEDTEHIRVVWRNGKYKVVIKNPHS